MQTVTSTDGTRIAYETRGEGPPLVCLHGGGTRRYWDPLVPHFADDYTVVTPDRRGRGDSGDDDRYTIQREVEDVHAVVDALDDDPVLFGHSFGGLQALEAARTADVAAAVAYEPAYLPADYRETADLTARMQAAFDDGDRQLAMKRHLDVVLHDDAIDDVDAWLDDWPPWPDVVRHVENTIRMDRALETHAIPDAFDVDAPTLLLTGSDGPSHLRKSVRVVHDRLDDSHLVEFDELTHVGLTAVPERTAVTITDFLDERDVH